MNEPIIIAMREGKRGADVASATWNGREYEAISRHGASHVLARQLLAAGAPDMPIECRWPDARLRWSVPSLHRWAELTVSETDRQGPRVTRWKPFPHATVARHTAAEPEPVG